MLISPPWALTTEAERLTGRGFSLVGKRGELVFLFSIYIGNTLKDAIMLAGSVMRNIPMIIVQNKVRRGFYRDLKT
jgi:hypothetical protein